MRSDERSWAWTCSGPCGMSARTAVGEMPITLMRWRSTMLHRRLGFGIVLHALEHHGRAAVEERRR